MSSAGDVLRLREGLADKFGERELRPQRFRATMGDGTGAVKVPGKPNYVYVRRLGRGLIEECLNNRAAARDGLPIIAGYSHESPDTLQVLEVDWLSFSAPGAYPYTQHHHEAHELHNIHGGDDVVWVQSQQIMPLLVYPTNPASMRVNVFGGWYPWASGWHYFDNTLSADLTAHVPALPAEARYVLISIDGATETLQYTAGATFPIFLPPVDAENMLPAPPMGSIPIGAVYLPFGTTALDWDNLHDIRLFNQPTGGSITPGVHALLDATVHSDTATNAPTRGSLIVANATPLWDELLHPLAAGYALITSATDTVWDQTPAWTGEHSFAAGVAFTGASGANEITIPDNIAIALEVLDAGGLEYMRVVSTDTQPVMVFNFGEADVDFQVCGNNITNALFVQGSTGFVAVGRNAPVGHLDVYDIAVSTTISYYGIRNEHVKTLGATDFADLLEGVRNYIELDQNGAVIGYFTGICNRTILTSGSVGNGVARDMRGIYNYLWMEDATCAVTGDVRGVYTYIDLNGGTIGDDVAGHYVYVHLRAGLTSIGGDVFGIKLYLDADTDPVGTAYSVYWEEGTNVDYGIYQNGTAPNRFGGHVDPASASGQDLGDATHRWDLYTQDVTFGGATGANVITVPDNIADALGLLDAGGLEYVRVVSTDANPYLLVDPAGAGVNFGIGTATPGAQVEILKDQGNVELWLTTYKTTAAAAWIRSSRARGTKAVPTVVANNDVIGGWIGRGYSAAFGGFRNAAQINFYIDGVPDSGGDLSDMPGRITFHTTPDGSSATVERVRIDSAGDVIIAILGGGGNQDVGADNTGKLYVPFVSDRKFKDNITALTGGLDAIKALRGVTYDWNPEALAKVGLNFGECGLQVGLVAQEVAEAIPLAANNGAKYQSFNSRKILPYLIESIKELDTRLTQLGA